MHETAPARIAVPVLMWRLIGAVTRTAMRWLVVAPISALGGRLQGCDDSRRFTRGPGLCEASTALSCQSRRPEKG